MRISILVWFPLFRNKLWCYLDFGMTLREARGILGLGADDDPRPLMAELRKEREMLAAMVRDAPNDGLAMRHQEDLVRFDRALAAVRETLEALGLRELRTMTVTREVVGEPAATPASDDQEEKQGEQPAVCFFRTAIVFLFLLCAVFGGAFWAYWGYQDRQMEEFASRIEALTAAGNADIENRRWQEAGVVFLEIERLLPDSPIARLGRERIEAGIAEEQLQFIGYWTGEARAALDSSRWEDAEAAARKVLERFPDQLEAASLHADIAAAKLMESRRNTITAVTTLLDRGDLEAAVAAATELEATHEGDGEIVELANRTRSAFARRQADLARAEELFGKARARDTGSFDAETLEWMREAVLLAPEHEAIAEHLEKIASYTRTIRVPEDIADLEEAIANAREKDRILLGPGTWQGTFVINLPIDLQGTGPGETHLECPAMAGCALTLGPEATGARISGITFRHLGFDAGDDRYSAALVRGGSVVFVDCHFIDASGHGLAVIEGAQVEIQRCQFRGNGWNGIAITGETSAAIIRESEISKNFGHGVESWNGGRLTLTSSRLEGNSGNGTHIDTAAAGIRIESCEILGNREFGIVLTAAHDGRLTKNRIRKNQLGGIAIRKAAAGVHTDLNDVSSNSGPGFLLDHGLNAAPYQENTIQGNGGSQILTQADLTPAPAE